MGIPKNIKKIKRLNKRRQRIFKQCTESVYWSTVRVKSKFNINKLIPLFYQIELSISKRNKLIK
jgi:hypothetical protein